MPVSYQRHLGFTVSLYQFMVCIFIQATSQPKQNEMSREEWLSIIPRRGGRSENDSGLFKCERPPRRQASASEHYDVLDAQLACNLYYPDDHPEIVRGDAEFLRLHEAGGDVWIDPKHPRPRFIKAMDERKIRPRDLNELLKQMIEWAESYACRWMKKGG